MKMKIAIIDYGAGNTANVKNAFDKLGANAILSSSDSVWKTADALVLPGVGSYGAAVKKLAGKEKPLIDIIQSGKPFLGICLGMQLLLEKSEEDNAVSGFGIFTGQVKRFEISLPVPQIAWNKVKPSGNSNLFDGLDDFYAYFVHSYYCEPDDQSIIAATSDYGIRFASALSRKNLFATQFHPEKSGAQGLQLLGNFLKLVKK